MKNKTLPVKQIAIALMGISILLICWPWMAGQKKFDITLPVQAPLSGEMQINIQQPDGLPLGETRNVEMALTWNPQDASAAAPAGLLEARLDMPGMQVDPPGTTSQALQAGLVHHFAWQVTSTSTTQDMGSLWVYWRPLIGERVPLMVRPIPCTGMTFVGLGAPASRWVGGAGLVVAFLLWITRKQASKKRMKDSKAKKSTR